MSLSTQTHTKKLSSKKNNWRMLWLTNKSFSSTSQLKKRKWSTWTEAGKYFVLSKHIKGCSGLHFFGPNICEVIRDPGLVTFFKQKNWTKKIWRKKNERKKNLNKKNLEIKNFGKQIWKKKKLRKKFVKNKRIFCEK